METILNLSIEIKGHDFIKKKKSVAYYINRKLDYYKGNADKKLDMDEVWNTKKKESVVDKISFAVLLSDFKEMEEILLRNGLEKLLGEEEEFTQTIFSVNQDELTEIVKEILGDLFNQKNIRIFLKNLLINLDFILLKKKLITNLDTFLIPLLFPLEKPSKKITLKGFLFLFFFFLSK